MQKVEDKIIIDTNLWVSYLLTRQMPALEDILDNQQIEILFSKELWKELSEVVTRRKFQKYFELDDPKELLELISTRVQFVIVSGSAEGCRDVKDNFLLALAKEGKADLLITGDTDLLEMKTYEATRIIKITDWPI